MELVVVLLVVVGLVVVGVVAVAAALAAHPLGIGLAELPVIDVLLEQALVAGNGGLGHAVPGLVGFLAAREGDELEQRVLGLIAGGQVVRFQIRRRPVHVAIGADAREAAVHREVLAQQPGAELHRVFPGVEGAVGVAGFAVGLAAVVEGADVEAGPEGRAPVLARAHPALHLQ